MKNCIFCDNSLYQNKSNEHVIPLWLLELLNIGNTVVTPTTIKVLLNNLPSRKHNLYNLKAGNICRMCNNGWLSNLENEVKKIATPLIIGQKNIKQLSASEKLILAKWTLKTAYVLNSSSNYRKNVPQDHFKYLKNENFFPPGIYILGLTMNTKVKFYWIQGANWAMEYSPNLDKEKIIQESANLINQHTYKIAFLFGDLILLVAYINDSRYIPIMNKKLHTILYMTNKPIIWSNDDSSFKKGLDKKTNLSQGDKFLINYILSLQLRRDH